MDYLKYGLLYFIVGDRTTLSAFKRQEIDYQYLGAYGLRLAPNFAPVIRAFELKRLYMGENLYQFRKAALQDCGGDIKKRWYISFYVWDVQKNDLVRKREYSINLG